MTRSHKIGYIASFPVRVIRDINAISWRWTNTTAGRTQGDVGEHLVRSGQEADADKR